MGINLSSEYSDVLNDGYVAGSITVGTTQVEAKVGASKQVGRELLIIYNKSNNTIYYGPSGVTTSTGIPIFKNSTLMLSVGENTALFLIAGSAGNSVLVQELA